MENHIEQLTRTIKDLKLMIENLSPDMAEMIISESITTDQLKRALKTMSRITISDDRLQHQHDEFMKLWQQINDAIQQNTEEWKAENLSLIERVAGRAQELIQMFEHELERTLLQESESQEPQAQTTGSADVIQIEGADSSNVTPSLQMEQEDHDDPVNDNINVIIEQMRAPPAANQVQPNVSQQMISSPNDGQQPGTSSASQAVVPQITPHQENLEQLNRITMMVATDNNFTLKQLFMYNRCMNELQTIPSMGNSPTQQGFRDVREFITGFIEKMSKLRVSANHYEPFLMGRVISVLSPTVVTQWGLQTIKGPAGLAQLREFLTNFEEIMIDGWNQEMASFEIPPAVEPEIDYSKTGAKPKQKPKDSVEKSDDNWSLPSRSGANTPTGATYLRTQPRFNKKDVAKAVKQAGNQQSKGPKGPSDPKDHGPKCLGCGGDHVLFRCAMFLAFNMETRWALVTRRRICPMCLVSRHPLINCHQGMCDHCEQPHNSALCEKSEQLRKQYKK